MVKLKLTSGPFMGATIGGVETLNPGTFLGRLVVLGWGWSLRCEGLTFTVSRDWKVGDLCGRILLALRQGRGVRILDHRSSAPGTRDVALDSLAEIEDTIARSPGTLLLHDEPEGDLVVVIMDH